MNKRTIPFGILRFLTGRPALLLFLLLGWCGTETSFGQSVENAKRMNRLLVQLKEAKKGTAKELFTISEQELNDFIAAAIEINKPQGLRKMVMNLQDNNFFYARAFIKAEDIALDGAAGKVLKTMFQGDQLVEAEGHIRIIKNKMEYNLDKTRINGMPIPSSLASELASVLVQARPPHIDIKEPFDLPYGISNVRIEKSRLIVER
jgi:hypothetical protein